MTQNAILIGDSDALEQMKSEDDPVILKSMGKKVKKFNEVTWKQEIDNILLNGLGAKFTQNTDLSSFLKTTGSNVLVEANSHDKTFAVGLPLLGKDIWNKK